jgi:16S rRNA (cytosine1402-N4)-methyltransferase
LTENCELPTVNYPHIPILVQPILDHLLPAERVIDGTLGAGGHSAALLEAGAGELLGLDLDPMALEIASERLAPFGDRAHIRHASYATMTDEATRLGWAGVEGILLDLGISSMQIDRPERGFAFMQDGPLDMRFDTLENPLTAAVIVNKYDERVIADILYNFGEESQSRRIARAIVARRPHHTTFDLVAAIESVMPRRRTDKIHPATRTFQALRMAVNDELGVIERALPAAIDLLRPGGKLAVISFHSLEDRLVKQAFKLASTDCICPPKMPVCICGHHASVRPLTHKPLIADEAETAVNPRSRSAKLRVVERLAVGAD